VQLPWQSQCRSGSGSLVVNVWDPAIYRLVGITLTLAALGSYYLPVRRASAMEPIVVLRED
jgi:ABC-type antimicrobial peptide transport system permease subunit